MSDAPRLTSLSISVSESQRAWIDAQVAANGYGSTSAFVGALIDAEQKRRAQNRLEVLIQEGLDSGPAEEFTPESWARMRADLEASAIELRRRKGLE